jgi:hypothetical protein
MVIRKTTGLSVAKTSAPVISWTAHTAGRFVLSTWAVMLEARFLPLGAAVLGAAVTLSAQNAVPVADTRLSLTVDSITRGPDLVGYPPDSLRWSADSSKLYFDWILKLFEDNLRLPKTGKTS